MRNHLLIPRARPQNSRGELNPTLRVGASFSRLHGKALLKNSQPCPSAEPAAPLLPFLHGAADVLEGEGARPFLTTQAPHVNSLNKCSHFSQLIHPHVRMLKLCQTLNAANSPTVHRS